jgi:hypothetical protein
MKRLYSTDDLRHLYYAHDTDMIRLRDANISREEIKTEIRWRVWWERFRNYLLLIGAVAAVIAAVEGAMPTGSLPSSGGAQSPSGGSVIPVLALVVAILAVFFGPLVARANTQRQIRVTTREAWMREFREQVATIMATTSGCRLLIATSGTSIRLILRAKTS